MILTKVSLRELTAEERQTLEQLARSRTAQARFAERAQILLALADGGIGTVGSRGSQPSLASGNLLDELLSL